MTNNQWYSNKELFEKIVELQREMQETRAIIRRYNNLYEKVYNVQERIQKIEAETEGKKEFGQLIREWGGWIFGLVTLIILIYTTFN